LSVSDSSSTTPRNSGGDEWRRRASLLLMSASGFAGLGYQIVWTQQSAVWLGHESAAVLAVVAAFFGGLAIGALLFGPSIETSSKPARWYAACELIIAAWSLVLTLAMTPFGVWMLRMTGVMPPPAWQWLVAFVGTFLLLLPATAAMGATLPAMERVIAQVRAGGRSIAALYASNTFGAVIGVLGTAFWLIPRLGMTWTAGFCAALNLLCGVTALFLFRHSALPPRPVSRDSSAARGVLSRLAMTGLLGIGYEVLVVRVLSQVAEDTVYTFAMLLAVYLVGTAAGAAGYQRALLHTRDQLKLDERLLCALAAACLIGTATLWSAEYMKTIALQWFGASMAAAIAADTLLALVAFGPPTIVMGALFSHLSSRTSALGVSFGRALGVNTLGAAAAPAVFGVLALAVLGPKLALLSISVGYLALTVPRAWITPIVWVPASAALALAIWAPPLAFIDIPDGGHVVSYQDGIMAAVSVVEDADGVARLRINNRQQEGSSSTLRVDGRQGLLPVLLHPAPRHALFLGLGTGVTASSAAQESTLQVDAVELLPEVITASRHFTRRLSDDSPTPRLHLIAADARRYVRASERRYDVIVSDNFHPARSGSGALYTVEHFEAVRARLEADGLFCQWLPLHQLDLQTLRSIVQSFISVYPSGWAMLASNSLETPVLGLVGRRDAGRFDVATLRDRTAGAAQPERLAYFGLEDEFALLGSFVAGPRALRRFAGDVTANTDYRPVVAYRAPRMTYAPDSLPRDRLIELLREVSIEPEELITARSDSISARRVAAYWAARNRFIESGRNVRPSPDLQNMLAQVREPLLSVLRISPDFRPAYDPLLLMATTLARTDVAAARTLLTQLAETQPARAEAPLALTQIGDALP
jgi:spermidine synthase